jgi:gliding motility-associated protein GldM
MAGGAKESPRQRMINMMYLVLTALLALQVSNSVLEKFQFIDESLQHTVNVTSESSGKVLAGIKEKVQKDGNREKDMLVLKKAEEVRRLTQAPMEKIKEMREKIAEMAGGIDPETGMYANGKDYDQQMNYTIGVEGGEKDGEAYKLKDILVQYINSLNTLVDSLNADQIALDAKDMDQFKNNPDQKNKDFAQLNFDHTPNVACLAVLSYLQSEVVQAEAKALERLAQQIGADMIKFDVITAYVSPESKYVAAGTKYTAEMFIAATSKSLSPTMTKDGSPIPVENGKGKIEFTAASTTYDNDGNAKKTYRGCIKVPRPSGDTIICIDVDYFVVKPVLQVQAAAVSALYLNCGNEIQVNCPALGIAYDPRFTTSSDAELIPGAKKGLVTIVPRGPKVELTVSSAGSALGIEKFNVRKVPLPTVRLFHNGKPVDLKNGIACSGALDVKIIPDESFKEFLPKDARYRPQKIEVLMVRGKKVVGAPFNTTNAKIDMNALCQGQIDRVVVTIEKIERMNFKDQKETVPMGEEIIQLPIQ